MLQDYVPIVLKMWHSQILATDRIYCHCVYLLERLGFLSAMATHTNAPETIVNVHGDVIVMSYLLNLVKLTITVLMEHVVQLINLVV